MNHSDSVVEHRRYSFVRPTRIALLLLSILCFGLAAYYSFCYLADIRYLRQYVRSHYGDQLDLPAIEQLTINLARLPGGETTSRLHYWNPLMQFLRATPRQVLEHGGFCGNKVRLMVHLLRLQGITARKLYLYGDDHSVVHTVTEFWYQGRWRLTDPHKGVLFRLATGEPATLSDVRGDPTLIPPQVPANSVLRRLPGLEARRVRWNKLPWGEQLYALLVDRFGKQDINGMSYPYILTQPYLVLAAVFSLGGLTPLFAGICLRRDAH